MRKITIAILAIALISFAIGAYFYFFVPLPENIASHWGIQGEVNGYLPKFWGLFLMPIFTLVMLGIFMLIPKIDPLKANIKKFMKEYEYFVLVITLFMFYVYLLSLAWNIGYRFSFTQFLVPAIAALFFYCGVLIEKAKRNWFIGIRTPWTMSNDKIWASTHKLGGKLYKASAVISLLGILLPDYAIFFMLVPIIFVSIYLVIYSYLGFRKIRRKRR